MTLHRDGATVMSVQALRGTSMSKYLTHEDIAVEPDKFAFVMPTYDHKLQKSSGSTPLMSGMGTPTFNGTQTYNHNGQPSDSDQDNDRSD